MENQSTGLYPLVKKVSLWLIGVFAVIIFINKAWENLDAGEIAVIQSPISGNLTVAMTPGWVWQGGGTITKYKRSNQLWFDPKESDGATPINVGFNDFGQGAVFGSVRWYMPSNQKDILKLHQDYGTQEAIEQKLIKQAITKGLFFTGPLMSSKEAVSEKKTALLTYSEDQANNGIYRTRAIKNKDTLIDSNSKLLEIVYKNGIPQVVKASDVDVYGVVLSNLTISKIDFSGPVTKQIEDQQKLVMAVQTSKATAQKAIQDAITTKANGEASAAKAKWEQEVIKAKLVTKAEADKEVATLDVQTALLKKQKLILEGEGEAAKKRLAMQANGALEQKLATYEKVQKYWAENIPKYQGNWVPTYMSGGTGAGNAGFNFMELMSAKAARDLGLDMSNKK